MPPKRGKAKKSPAPTRRSARIQSREPSAETESVPAIIAPPQVPLPAPRRSPSPDIVIEKAPRPLTKAQRELKLKKIREDYQESLAEEQTAAPLALMPPPYPTPSKHPGLIEYTFQSTAPQNTNEAEEGATHTTATTTPQRPAEEEQGHSGWRKVLTAVGGYFVSPFTRKRSAEDDDDTHSYSQPAAKRSRVEESPKQLLNDIIPVAQPVTDLVRPISSIRKRQAEDASGESPTKRARVEAPKPSTRRLAASPSPEDTVPSSRPVSDTATRAQQQTPGRTDKMQQAQTPKSAQRESPRNHSNGPSTRNQHVPTSLSTITEYTEPSFISRLSQIEESSPTPSKPSRAQQPSKLLDVPQSTPVVRRIPRTPRLLGTPTIHRAAMLRAAREANSDIGTPSTVGFSSLRKAAPKPKESNADVRQAKLERMRRLEKELAELQQDEDIKEMQSHRRKRVKIDRLVSIPHNLPGDPSGMFRVPEGDSDDEMEVYDDVEERSNVFEDSERSMDDSRSSVMSKSFGAPGSHSTPKAFPSTAPAPPAAATPRAVAATPRAVAATPATVASIPASVQPTVKAVQPGNNLVPAIVPAPAAAPSQIHNTRTFMQPAKPDISAQAPGKDTTSREGSQPLFTWPDVGRAPQGYFVGEAYKAEAGALFGRGLVEFLAV